METHRATLESDPNRWPNVYRFDFPEQSCGAEATSHQFDGGSVEPGGGAFDGRFEVLSQSAAALPLCQRRRVHRRLTAVIVSSIVVSL